MKDRLKHISIDDHYRFPHIKHIGNACFGKNYKGWQRATMNVHGDKCPNYPWFPKLAIMENGVDTAQDKVYGLINTINADGTIIKERRNGDPNVSDEYEDCIRYVFVKPAGQPYRYAGNFKKDNSASNGQISVFYRVSTELDLSEWCDEPLNRDTPVEYYQEGE